ncbi:hypothetical protein GCM10011349_47210 [Novosphingobium indicum]|uniref:Uncharacterized protein n=1 Tax=Novosphingobium indicum TaxID=462949 RepID=A0ABQ2K1Y5_9SPHN|nr:hypothetical protein GCM10011349_47210 [Novosphingobium indicum]
MINWRSAGSRVGEGKVFIVYLLSVQTAQQGIPKVRVDQEVMEIGQRIYGNPNATQAERIAHLAIQHPSRNYDDFAGAHHNVGDSAVRPVLGILAPHSALERWMPSIPDDNVVPDMGRMSARWRSIGIMRSAGLCASADGGSSCRARPAAINFT